MILGIIGVKSTKEVECMLGISNPILVNIYYEGSMCCGEHNRAQGKGELLINRVKENSFMGNITFRGKIGCVEVSQEPVDVQGEVKRSSNLYGYRLVLNFEFDPPYLPKQL